MIAYHDGEYVVKRDGTSFYRVYVGRKLVGSFLSLAECIKYIRVKKRIAD